MTEQTATQTPVEAPAPAPLPAPEAGDTKRAYLVRHGLAKAVDKNGVAPRGRFGKEGVAALAAAEAAGFVFADAPKASKPRVAKTSVPAQAEGEQVTPADVAAVSVPLPEAPPVVRAETEARGRFFGRGKKGRR